MNIFRFQNVSLTVKIALIVGVLLLPLAAISYFHVKQNTASTAAAKAERVGVAYLRNLQPALLMATATEPSATVISARSLDDPDAATLNISDHAKTLEVAFAVAHGSRPTAKLASQVSDLIGSMSDASALSLDPDIDSYYLQDALIVQLTAMLTHAQELSLAVHGGQVSSSPEALSALTATVTKFGVAKDAFTSDISKAVAGDQSGDVGRHLDILQKALSEATAKLYAAAQARDAAAINAAVEETRSAASAFMSPADDMLDTLLASRIAAIHSDLFMELGTAGILVFIALGFALLTAVSFVGPMAKMTAAMGELAAGNLQVEVPGIGRKDEVGKLASATAAFKEQLIVADKAKAEQERMRGEHEKDREEQVRIIVDSIGVGLDSLAKGDLTHRIGAELSGPFAKLKDDLNKAMGMLQETMKDVLSSTGTITTGAGEIMQAANDLSKRTEHQAASLEETAAALEQITATVKKTAQNTKEVSTIVASAKSAAENGGAVVSNAITAMYEIEQSSKKITDIIGVIDEIAFQTNLLALNAGVEAARAGDAGKGFAVVASEVRALAQRSGEAAKQIKTLIKASSEQVGSGVRLVDESGQALKQLAEQVIGINALVSEMAEAAQQQSTGIEEVNTAVSQMDQVTQQNAAMVEQSTAASRNLSQETGELSRLMAFFDVGAEAAMAKPQLAARRDRPAAPRRVAAAGRRLSAVPKPEAEAVDDDWQEF